MTVADQRRWMPKDNSVIRINSLLTMISKWTNRKGASTARLAIVRALLFLHPLKAAFANPLLPVDASHDQLVCGDNMVTKNCSNRNSASRCAVSSISEKNSIFVFPAHMNSLEHVAKSSFHYRWIMPAEVKISPFSNVFVARRALFAGDTNPRSTQTPWKRECDFDFCHTWSPPCNTIAYISLPTVEFGFSANRIHASA